jgi:subtilisin family serine protease
MAQGSPQADTVDGILGIYTGSFPDHSTPASTDSEYGWARWAGTSFATPIIAGVLALLRSDGKLAAQAKKTIEDTIIETPVGTHIFLVDQK